MFAKNLEYLLAECFQQSDVSLVNPLDIAQRFERLRGYGRLPRGRENRAKRLDATEITGAILGFVPANPNWAGHAAVILSNLQPVGGSAASFHGAINLSAAMERLLTDSAARQSLRHLTISAAEGGINSNGFAILAYTQAGNRQVVEFVSGMAVSRLQPGAQNSVDPDRFYAPASRCVVLNRYFFDRVAAAIARATEFLGPPAGDGSEYDAEEAKEARYKALGVKRGSRFLNVGVDTQATWPDREMLVHFDRYRLVLMPKTKENACFIHVDLQTNRLTQDQARTVIYRFLSVLSWCDDQFTIVRDGWSGNPVPVAVPRRNLAFVTACPWLFDRRIPQSDEVRRALALYREGHNSEEAALISYAVLNYFKIIEIRYPHGPDARKWIGRNLHAALSSTEVDPQVQEFFAGCGSEAPEQHIYNSLRVAVAHASPKYPSDSDDSEEIGRLYSGSFVLRLLARHFIANELGVSDSPYSGD